jgi:CDP-glucose 4,6-dehydratase
MNRRFWSGKRVFVTGHTGFKGGWLCAWLLGAGADVAGYALDPPTTPSLFEAARLGEAMKSTIADVRDVDALAKSLRAQKPEVVFHLAAQALVRASYALPVETFAVNAIGTAHVLEAIRRASSVRAAIIVTSDKCYDLSDAAARHVESDRLGGRDPYSASKACAELVTAAYRDAFLSQEIGVATARAGNVIGGGDFAPDRLVPDLIRAFSAGSRAKIRRPGAVRPWQHVLDPLAGYLALAEALCADGATHAGAWNFGPPPDHELPVAWVADECARVWGGRAAWVEDGGEHPHESADLRLDSAKALAGLGWRARIPLTDAISWTVRWHRALGEGAGARDLVLGDVERFEERAG